MFPIRNALLISVLKSHRFAFQKLAILGVTILYLPLNVYAVGQVPFQDLPPDPMYKEYIETFQAANLIVGDTQGGVPQGVLRPNDFIQRAEFAKIAALVRLLENRHQEGQAESYQNLGLNEFTVKVNTDLTPYYQTQPGDVHFEDVPNKPVSCAQVPAGCEPWFGQYVNFATHEGLIKGYPDATFRPSESILRIHALKLIMAQDGNVPAAQDSKFKQLSADPRIKNVQTPKCLKGAEPYLIQNNGGYSQDAHNLLSYAILADKLDLFGNQCQLFEAYKAYSPKERADLLQKPLTRKEIARYYALTTTYPFLLSSSDDETISTEAENGMNYYGETPSHEMSDSHEMSEDENEKESISQEPETEEVKESVEEEVVPAVYKTSQEKASMTVAELAALNQKGRCCSEMSLNSSCKLVLFKNYSISETSSYNVQNYDGGLWQKANRPGEVCWIPFGDLLSGYNQLDQEAGICSMNAEHENLVTHYLNAYLKMEVTRIWTAQEGMEVKFYRQLSLDLALKTAKDINGLLKVKKPDCQKIDTKLAELKRAHEAVYY